MRKKFEIRNSKFEIFVFICLVFTVYSSLFTFADAKVYIDITAPSFRKLPISISHTGDKEAEEIAGIIKDDLDFSGIFILIDPDIPGAEIRVSVTVETSERIKADVSVFDLIKNKEVLKKDYVYSIDKLRALSHRISDDIFKIVTGRKGIFRTKLSYIVSASQRRELYIMDWDGHNPKRIVAKGMTFSHTWSPDSRYIIYSSERDRAWAIYLIDLRNYREMVFFSSKGLNLVGGAFDDKVAFSSSKDGSPEIYVMNINGSKLRKITRSFGIDISPVFSPDGSRIAFVSDRGGSPQIYTMNSDGTSIRRLTFEGSYNTSPVWSPDGRWIAFVGRKNGNNQIFMIKSDGTDLRQLTEKGNNESPTFSPDGMFIGFDSNRDGIRGVYIMNLNDGRLKRITPKNIKAMNPRWSPYMK
jgi:TolB protein